MFVAIQESELMQKYLHFCCRGHRFSAGFVIGAPEASLVPSSTLTPKRERAQQRVEAEEVEAQK